MAGVLAPAHLAQREQMVVAWSCLNADEANAAARRSGSASRLITSQSFLLAKLSKLGAEQTADLSQLRGRRF